MKAMGFSKTVVTGVALNSDSTSGDYGKLTVTKNTGQNGADQSSTIDLPSIYAKKNDILFWYHDKSKTATDLTDENWLNVIHMMDNDSQHVASIQSAITNTATKLALNINPKKANSSHSAVHFVAKGAPSGSSFAYSFEPAYGCTIDLGGLYNRWENIYINGKINNLVLPSGGGTLATTDQIPTIEQPHLYNHRVACRITNSQNWTLPDGTTTNTIYCRIQLLNTSGDRITNITDLKSALNYNVISLIEPAGYVGSNGNCKVIIPPASAKYVINSYVPILFVYMINQNNDVKITYGDLNYASLTDVNLYDDTVTQIF